MPLDQATAAKRTILAGHNRTESAKVDFHPFLGICIVALGRRSRSTAPGPSTPVKALTVEADSGLGRTKSVRINLRIEPF
jgi:hypothetical protein